MSYARGDRVVVIRGGTYKEVPQGATGTVRSEYNGNIAVVIDGIINPRSSYNCFYFTTRCIKHINEKESKIMEGNYRIAQISFLEGNNTDKKYPYACYDDSIEIGDICVVASEHHGLGIAKVIDIGPKTDEKITREIICKCDFGAYNARVANRKRRAELIKQMHNRAAELQEVALFKMMAENDDGMKSLLNEFNAMEVY